MAKSKLPRGKKYRPAPAYGNRVVPPKPKWMRTLRAATIVVLSILGILAIISMIIRYVQHMNH